MLVMRKFRSVCLVSVVALLSLPLLQGCVAIVAAGAGAGAYAYLKGSLESHLNASLESSLPAVRQAMDDMNYVKIKEVSDMTSARFIYRDSLDNRVTVELDEKQSSLTEIMIRVGTVGNEDRSIEILNAINSNL